MSSFTDYFPQSFTDYCMYTFILHRVDLFYRQLNMFKFNPVNPTCEQTACYLHSCGILLTFCSDSCTFILNAVDQLYRLNNNTHYFLLIPVGLLYRKLYKIVFNFVYEVYRFLYICIYIPPIKCVYWTEPKATCRP